MSRSFHFHYNKPASKKAGEPQISIHIDKTCWIVGNIQCKVPTTGKINKRQPFFVMKGKCDNFIITWIDGKNVAILS